MSNLKIKMEMKLRLPEYFDSYLLVGIVPGANSSQSSVVIIARNGTKTQTRMLRAGVVNAMLSHGIIAPQ